MVLPSLFSIVPVLSLPPPDIERTGDGVVADGDGTVLLGHLHLAITRIGDSRNGEAKAGHEGRRDHRSCKQTLTHLHLPWSRGAAIRYREPPLYIALKAYGITI